jgi:hypothetical protein
VSRLDEIGRRDGWRCWICDEAVDPLMDVNDARGPSIDSRTAKPSKPAKSAKARSGSSASSDAAPADGERLAHRACNTRKGAVTAVVPWPQSLFVVDPAPIITSLDRLQRKGGREVMARCPTRADGDAAAAWLLDRIGRLRPGMTVATKVEAGGGQFVVILSA